MKDIRVAMTAMATVLIIITILGCGNLLWSAYAETAPEQPPPVDDSTTTSASWAGACLICPTSLGVLLFGGYAVFLGLMK